MNDSGKTLKVGIIGLGDVSPFHIQAIQMNEQAELVAVCDTDSSAASKADSVPFYTDYQEMIQAHDLDVVHNCLPHYLHYPVTKDCVEAGFHVLLEKPVAISYEEALLQKTLEDTYPQKICVCFQNRYNPTFLEMLHWLNKEETWTIRGIKGLVTWYREQDYYETKPWRKTRSEVGYGNIMSQSIHTLDLIQLLGGRISSVKASLSKLLDVESEVEDTVSASFQFETGTKGYLHATNANVSNSSVELEVITDTERLTIKDSTLYRTVSTGEKEVLAEDEELEGAKSYFGSSHTYLIDSFYRAILEDTNDYITVEDALPSIELIEMMADSSNSVAEPKRIYKQTNKSLKER